MDVGIGDPDVIRIVAMRQRRSARLDFEVEDPHPRVFIDDVMMRLSCSGHGLLGLTLGLTQGRADKPGHKELDEPHARIIKQNA